MADVQAGNPLHGITLKMILDSLVERYGWDELGRQVDIRCFTREPSVASSLKFLRRTPWAREKVEALYLRMPRREAGRAGGVARAAGGLDVKEPS